MDSKSPEAFRTISEVAEWLDVPTHVLRFWESRFTQVKPVKRAGGRRYYRPADMELLGGIKRLLHDDGLTIRGVQKLLREEGVRHVAALSPSADAPEGLRGSRSAKTETETGAETPMAVDVPVQSPLGKVVNFVSDTEAPPGMDPHRDSDGTNAVDAQQPSADPDAALRRWPFLDEPTPVEDESPAPQYPAAAEVSEPPLQQVATAATVLARLRATPAAKLEQHAESLRPLVARMAALHARLTSAG
ncbi:MAG: MerR family transcriptional regulator [Rhodobacterales bacterium]|nr:MerR family transcriptional regulator [Rhodobacterales bacterium]